MFDEELLNADKENDMYVTGNNVETWDFMEYWAGVDAMFVQRRKTDKAYYANGHMSVSTSNLMSWVGFLGNLTASTNPQYVKEGLHLTKTINRDGFDTRVSNGKVAGRRLVEELIKQDYAFGDTLDIVCHSMGFAYAQGMLAEIEAAIKDKRLYIHLGGYYIIAPENPSSGTVDVSKWDQIWQYGSDETNHRPQDQDGIAVQRQIVGLSRERRSFIPDDVPKGFIESHKIKNYKWIFNSIINPNAPGYVTPRK